MPKNIPVCDIDLCDHEIIIMDQYWETGETCPDFDIEDPKSESCD